MAPSRRVPQLNDDVVIELRLPPQTEEWAEDVIHGQPDEEEYGECERTDDALIVRYEVGGNCNGITSLRSWLSDLEDAFREGDIDPMEFEVKVMARERVRG